MQRTPYLLINIIAILLLLTSCATKTLWKKHEYPEVFQQYLTTEDHDKVVIIGEKYHYILESDNELKHILEWKDKNILNANFYKVYVDRNNTITGSYNISVPVEKLSDEQKEWLENNGFTPNTNERLHTLYLSYKSKLKGQRYLANNNELIKKKFPIGSAKNSAIGIREEFSNSEKAYRLAASPIAVAADGVVIGTLIVLIGLSSPSSNNYVYLPTPKK